MRKAILWLAGGTLACLVLVMVAWILVAGPVTVYRVLRYGDTTIDDFKDYPFRRLRASTHPFRFNDDSSTPPVSLPDLSGTDTIAFLVVKDSRIVLEHYNHGHSASSLSQCFSVSKSITSALIGMAIDDGVIRSVDQPLTDLIPELEPHGFASVRLRHLLTMMSGSDYVENDNPFGEHVIFNYTPRLEREILKIRMETEPGRLFRYKSGDNALLALMLSRALAPRTITDYAQEKLWSPLGMEHHGIWSLDHEGGLEKTWCCLAASARDFARLGRLYLREGDWDGRRILSADWVRQSTRHGAVPAAQWDADYARIGVRNYGYQWWLGSTEEEDYFGLGKDGQFLYVNPRRNVVIVRLGRTMGDLRLGRWLALFRQLSMESDQSTPR